MSKNRLNDFFPCCIVNNYVSNIQAQKEKTSPITRISRKKKNAGRKEDDEKKESKRKKTTNSLTFLLFLVSRFPYIPFNHAA